MKLVEEQLALSAQEPARWKWVVIGLHNALTGVCVCALTQTDGSGVWKSKQEKEFRAALYANDVSDTTDADEVLRDGFVESLKELLKRLEIHINLSQEDCWRHGKDDRERYLRLLHSLRNDFTHFRPQAWSIELAGLPTMVAVIIDFIEEIGLETEYHTHNPFPELDLAERIAAIRRLATQF
ncbi:MAG: hypothetical protein AAF568_07225 [Pseudomonadota bacterium]